MGLNEGDDDGLDDAIVEELSVVVISDAVANAIVRRVGIPSRHVPPFDGSAEFWRSVLAAAGDGGKRAVVEAAAEHLPHNELFERYLTSRTEAVPRYATRLSGGNVAGLEARDSGARSWPGKRLRDDAQGPPQAGTDPDVGHDDHLWDTGGSGSLRMLAPRFPTTTRGPTIIVGGRVRYERRPMPRCPDCDGALQPAVLSIHFHLAPEATAEQRVPGYRCACGGEWPDPFVVRSAHAAAFGVNGPLGP